MNQGQSVHGSESKTQTFNWLKSLHGNQAQVCEHTPSFRTSRLNSNTNEAATVPPTPSLALVSMEQIYPSDQSMLHSADGGRSSTCRGFTPHDCSKTSFTRLLWEEVQAASVLFIGHMAEMYSFSGPAWPQHYLWVHAQSLDQRWDVPTEEHGVRNIQQPEHGAAC